MGLPAVAFPCFPRVCSCGKGKVSRSPKVGSSAKLRPLAWASCSPLGPQLSFAHRPPESKMPLQGAPADPREALFHQDSSHQLSWTSLRWVPFSASPRAAALARGGRGARQPALWPALSVPCWCPGWCLCQRPLCLPKPRRQRPPTRPIWSYCSEEVVAWGVPESACGSRIQRTSWLESVWERKGLHTTCNSSPLSSQPGPIHVLEPAAPEAECTGMAEDRGTWRLPAQEPRPRSHGRD